jgi:hypothetical protein
MKANWYCIDCGTSIEKQAIEAHEADGHRVTGTLTPEWLLSNDPGSVGENTGDPGGGIE